MKTLLFLLLTLPLAGQLRIEAAGFNMKEWELSALFKSAIDAFPEPAREDPPVFISRHPEGPIVLFQRSEERAREVGK